MSKWASVASSPFDKNDITTHALTMTFINEGSYHVPHEAYRRPSRSSWVINPLCAAMFITLVGACIVGIVAGAVSLQQRWYEDDERDDRTASSPQHISAVSAENTSPISKAVLSNTWYAFATNKAAGILETPHVSVKPDARDVNVQMATSADFTNWELASPEESPLQRTGNWAADPGSKEIFNPDRSTTWAPAVFQRSDGKFVLYYSAAVKGPNPYRNWPDPDHPAPHCIGAAVSRTDSPAGPYEPEQEALVCPVDQGGAIDPQVVSDVDGTIWLAYKVDGNNIGNGGQCGNTEGDIVPTPIMLQKLQDDGLTKLGQPIEILRNILSDGPLVEAPMLVRSYAGVYFLFFSSGCTRLPTYTTHYATSINITGPYTRTSRPLLKTGDWELEAPGSVGVYPDTDGGFKLAFHARVLLPGVGRVRAMFTSELELEDKTARLVHVHNEDTAEHQQRADGSG